MHRLSIITINLNNLAGLQKTVKSVFEQTSKDFEYIIIDGCSTDGSKELVEQLAGKLSYWISEKDNGVYYAMNKGIEKANGNYIMFLNSGDYLIDENVLHDCLKLMSQKDADIYYGNMIVEIENGKPFSKKHAPELSLDVFENQTINHQASFIKRELFKELGFYNTRYSIAADYAFYLKSFLNGKCFKYLDCDIVYYHVGGLSTVNADTYRLEMQEIFEHTIPGFVKTLRIENAEYKLLMKQRIMLFADKLNRKYHNLRNSLKDLTIKK